MDDSMRKGNQGEEFEHYRVLLFSIAYRMTGSASDAEDLVQETYLRYQASESSEIVSLKAYLTTISWPASRGAFLAERDAQKSAASDLDAGRDQWQPVPLVLG